jgi:hypothetical protein
VVSVKQDETALVKQAQEHAKSALARTGRVLPAAYMLVRRNPQTGALLTHPTAIGTELDSPFESREAYEELLDTVRSEAKRLDAFAVALCGEAEAEIEEKGRIVMRRVFFVRVEDQDGVHHMHARIEPGKYGEVRIGDLLLTPGATDDVDEPLLPEPPTVN